jgi:hypothetical protein
MCYRWKDWFQLRWLDRLRQSQRLWRLASSPWRPFPGELLSPIGAGFWVRAFRSSIYTGDFCQIRIGGFRRSCGCLGFFGFFKLFSPPLLELPARHSDPLPCFLLTVHWLPMLPLLSVQRISEGS